MLLNEYFASEIRSVLYCELIQPVNRLIAILESFKYFYIPLIHRFVRSHYHSGFYLRLSSLVDYFLVCVWSNYLDYILSMGPICQKANCSCFRKKSSMKNINWSWNCLLSLTRMNIFEVYSFQDYHFRHQVEFWSCWQVEIRSLTKREKAIIPILWKTLSRLNNVFYQR